MCWSWRRVAEDGKAEKQIGWGGEQGEEFLWRGGMLYVAETNTSRLRCGSSGNGLIPPVFRKAICNLPH